ncbi:MAG: putative glycoside hydrolase [Eubacteriales bacterium]
MGKLKNSNKRIFLCLILVIILTGLLACDNIQDNNKTETPTPDTIEDVDNNVIIDFSYAKEAPAVNHNTFFEPVKVKGLFVNAHNAGSSSSLDNLIKIADETEVNAFVIDVKDDNGYITFEMDLPVVNEVDSDRKIIRDIDGLMDKLYKHDIFPIARIVCFKDKYLAKNEKDYAIKNKDGSLWYYENIAWLNPYNRDSWEYIVDIAKEAAKVGFKEIQFDYIRFEATSSLRNADLGPESEDKKRTEIILEFLDYANEELEDYNVVISADVFGIIFLSHRDGENIGQDYIEMSKRLDVISPMVYPSHYGKGGYYGAPSDIHSDWYPYEILYGSMMNSNKELDKIPEKENRPIVRPWLQAFTAKHLKSPNYRVYGGEELREQIQGTYDAGLEEWILWNSSSNYNTFLDGLLKEGEE